MKFKNSVIIGKKNYNLFDLLNEFPKDTIVHQLILYIKELEAEILYIRQPKPNMPAVHKHNDEDIQEDLVYQAMSPKKQWISLDEHQAVCTEYEEVIALYRDLEALYATIANSNTPSSLKNINDDLSSIYKTPVYTMVYEAIRREIHLRQLLKFVNEQLIDATNQKPDFGLFEHEPLTDGELEHSIKRSLLILYSNIS